MGRGRGHELAGRAPPGAPPAPPAALTVLSQLGTWGGWRAGRPAPQKGLEPHWAGCQEEPISLGDLHPDPPGLGALPSSPNWMLG